MKKLMLVLVMMFAVTAVAMAATGNGVINVTCNTTLGIAVSTSNATNAWLDVGDNIALGTQNTGATVVPTVPFYIWNTSPVTAATVQTFQLQGSAATGGSVPWALSNGSFASNIDSYSVAAIFSPSTSALGAGSFTNTAALNTAATAWSATNFNIATSSYTYQTQANPTGSPVGGASGSWISLWTAIKTPTAVSSPSSHAITIAVIANMAGT